MPDILYFNSAHLLFLKISVSFRKLTTLQPQLHSPLYIMTIYSHSYFILFFSQYKAGMLSIERKIIPTLPLIERCVKSYHFLAQQKGISLNLVFEPMTNNLMSLMDSSLFVDENKISQVFRNLLSNAMKFSKKGK